MSKLLRRVRRWWRPTAAFAPTAVAFQVACLCGHVAHGHRSAHHQVMHCERCGGNVFVLPLSPLPPLPAEPPAPAAPPALARRRSSRPLLIGLVLFFLLVAIVLVWSLGVVLQPQQQMSEHAPTAGSEAVAARLKAATTHLDQGEVRLTLAELATADELERRHPDWFSAAQTQRLRRLHEQADILADLLAEPLEDLLRHADTLAPAEWQALCAQRYRGKAFALDVNLRHLPGGLIAHDYRLFVHGEPARLQLDDLAVLHGLPLETPQRVLMACRLADVRRTPGQPWVVRVQPGSGVLFTEPGAAHVCGLDPNEPGVRQVLERQARWRAGK